MPLVPSGRPSLPPSSARMPGSFSPRTGLPVPLGWSVPYRPAPPSTPNWLQNVLFGTKKCGEGGPCPVEPQPAAPFVPARRPSGSSGAPSGGYTSPPPTVAPPVPGWPELFGWPTGTPYPPPGWRGPGYKIDRDGFNGFIGTSDRNVNYGNPDGPRPFGAPGNAPGTIQARSDDIYSILPVMGIPGGTLQYVEAPGSMSRDIGYPDQAGTNSYVSRDTVLALTAMNGRGSGPAGSRAPEALVYAGMKTAGVRSNGLLGRYVAAVDIRNPFVAPHLLRASMKAGATRIR